jgi:hypothetical protein
MQPMDPAAFKNNVPDPFVSDKELGTNGFVISTSRETAALRERWLAYLIDGILLVILGAAATAVPNWATLTVTIFLGWLFLFSGIAGLLVGIDLVFGGLALIALSLSAHRESQPKYRPILKAAPGSNL